MKRLESIRRFRSVRGVAGQVRNAAEAVMVLAHVARERHRLEQERRSLGKRLTRIEERLTEIAGTEMRLVPTIQAMPHRPPDPDVSPSMPLAVAVPVRARAPLPAGVTQVTLQY
jgi:hypothetical protein